MNFLRGSMMAGDPGCMFRDDWGYLTVYGTNCEFATCVIAAYGISMDLKNCVFRYGGVGNVEGWNGNFVYLRNCTFADGGISLTSSDVQPDLLVEDCSFDASSISQSGYGFNGTFDYNAYLTGYQHLTNNSGAAPSGAHDIVVTNFNWQAGPAGNCYLPTDSPLIDAGSRNATNAGLYHFTTQVDQTKETNTVVDVGYHYVALANGNPNDADGDGIPDYLEDANGNGTVDSGEMDWQNASDLGLKVQITRPQNNSNLP